MNKKESELLYELDKECGPFFVGHWVREGAKGVIKYLDKL